MDNTTQPTRPDVLVTDFDRTLTYLYRDTNLLIDLADQMVAHYNKMIVVPEKYTKGTIDGYFVWHELHDAAVKELPKQNSEEINKRAEEIVANFELQIIKRNGLFPGVAKAIKTLHSYGLRLGVVSSNATSVVTFALQEAGILDAFEYIDGRPYPFNPKLIKPNPYPLKKALSSLNISSDSFWYVGDDVVDMTAAKAASVTAVGVCTGKHSRSQLLEAGADLLFSAFIDIPSYFEG